MSLRDLQRRFDHAAESFDSADFVHANTRDGLFARLQPMVIEAELIIDLGSATGASAHRLGKTFRRATIVPVDLSQRMLRKAAHRSGWFRRKSAVQADAANLPFADQSIDLVFSNLLLPWIADRTRVFTEIARILRPDGLFLFSTLGPDSLPALRHEAFADMHEVGDELVRAGLLDPVLDVDRLTVTYDDRDSLASDLAAVGAGDCLPELIDDLDQEFELVYGHCWGSGRFAAAGEFRIAPERIARRKA